MKTKFFLSLISVIAIMFLTLGSTTVSQAAPPAQEPTGDPEVMGPDIWTQRGPMHQLSVGHAPGVSVIRFDPINPNIVYSGTNQGVYRSLDAGMHWAPRSNGLGGYGDLVITDLEFDPTNTQTLYISTWGYGIFKSTDAGDNWVRVTDPLAGVLMSAMDESGDPNLPDIRRVGMHYTTEIRALNTNSEPKLPAKNDSLAHQPTVLPAVPADLNWTAVRNMAINPSNRLEMYAAISGYGIRRSLDGGVTWADYLVNSGDSGWDLQFARSNTNIRYASMDSGLYRTINGGANWQPVGVGIVTGTTFEISIHPTNPNIVLASANNGLYRTADGGVSWVSESSENALTDSLYLSATFAPSSPDTVYASAFVCVYRSLDAGATWAAINCAIPPYLLNTVTVSPNNNTYLLVGGDDFPYGGVYYVNGSSGVHSMASAGMDNTYVLSLEQDPLIPSILYAATWGAGIYKSTDSGDTWFPINGAYAPYVYSLETAVSGGSVVLYAGTFYVDWGILKSTDRGVTWTEVSNLYPSNISFDLEAVYNEPNYLVAATIDGIQVSLDGGVTWDTPFTLNRGAVLKLSEYANSGRLLAATYGGGIYASWGGASWFEANTGISGPNTQYTFDVEFSETNPGVAYAATNRIFMTNDYGETWSSMSAGLPGGEYVRSLAVSPTGVTVAGLQTKGVYYTTKAYDVWQPLNNGLYVQNVRSILVNSATQRVYAGTNGANIWDFQPSYFPASKSLYLPNTKRSWGNPPAADPYELNNTIGSATYLANPGDYYANISSTSDHDWYRIPINQLGPVQIELLDVPPGMDYDLELYSDTGMQIDGSYLLAGKPERIDFIPSRPMTLYIRVLPFGASVSPEFYRLKVSFNTARGSGLIYGNVKFYNANASNQPVYLIYYNGFNFKRIVTLTDSAGNYSFPGMATLPAGHLYFTGYDNLWAESNKLYNFQCYGFTGYVTGTDRNACNFDIGNVVHGTPAGGATVGFPVHFTWNSRGVAGDSYQVYFTDYDDYYKYESPVVGDNYYDLPSLPAGMSSATPYWWALRVVTAGGNGVSYYRRSITFNGGYAPDMVESDVEVPYWQERIEREKK